MKKLTGFAIFLIFAQIVLLTLIIISGTVISKSKDTFVKYNGNRNKVDQLTIESDFLNGENNSIDLTNKIRPGMGKIYGVYEKQINVSHKYEKPYSVLNPLKHKERWVLEYDPHFGPKRKVEVVISYKNGVKVNSIENEDELIDIIPKDILRKKNILDPDFLNNNPNLKNHLFYEDKELTKPINNFDLTDDEIDKLTDIYAIDINKGNYNYTIEYRKHSLTGELIDFSNTNLVNIFNYDKSTKQFKGKGNKDQVIPIMFPRLLGFKPKEPNKTSFKLENDNLIITVVYDKNINDYHQITFYSGNFGKINGQAYFEVLKNDKTLIENGIDAPSVIPVKGKLFTGWEPIFDKNAKLTETKIYVAQYVDDPEYSGGEYNYTINYLIKGTNKKVPTIAENPKTGKGALSYALSIPTPVAMGYEVAKNEAFEVIVNDKNVEINVYYVENNKQFQYKVLYIAKLDNGTEKQIPYTPQEGFGSVGQEIVVNKPAINGYILIPNQIDRITLLPDDSQNIVKIYYTVDKKINTFKYKVNYILKNTTTSIHPQVIGYGYAFEEITLPPHPVISGYKLAANQPTKVVVLSDESAVVNVYYEVDQNQKVYNYQIEFYINGTTNPVPGKATITGNAYINEEIIVDISPVPGFKVVAGTNNKYTIDQNNKLIKIYYEVDQSTTNYEGYVYYYIEGTTSPVPGITPNPVKFTGYHGKVFNIDHPVNNRGYKVKENQPTKLTIKSTETVKVEVFYEVDKTQKVYSYTINYLIKDTTIPVPGSTKKTGKAYIGEIISIDFPTLNGYKVTTGSSTTLKVDHDPSEIDIYYEVDTNVQTFTGRVNYYIKGTTNKVPGVVTHEIVNGYIGEVKTINAPVSTKGYKLDPTTTLPIKLTIKQDNSAVIDVYYVIDENQKIYNYKVYYYLQGTTNPVPGKVHILNGKAYINEDITLDTTSVPGYKAVNNQITVVVIDRDNKEFTIYYEVNTAENNFIGKVYYKIEGTDKLVEGLPENPKKFTGAADEVISITPYPTTTTGYKVKAGQPTTIKIKVDNSAEVTVYFEVDQSQPIYSYSIKFRVKDTLASLKALPDINGVAYINQEIPIPLVKANGYKPIAGSPDKLIVDQDNKEITILYELDITQNQFVGTIKYYVEGDTKHVPGIDPNPRTITGYHTEEINILPHPVVTTGYKVKENQPTKIVINSDGNAEVTVEYEVDQSQEIFNYEIRYIIEKTGEQVPGRPPLTGKAYINKEITIQTNDVINGYKVKPGTPDKIVIDKDDFLFIIYYVPDTTITSFQGQIEYRYKTNNNLVDAAALGLTSNPVIKTGHVLQEIVVDKPALAGYLVENPNEEKLIIKHDNSAKVIVYYIVNTGNIFEGKVYYKIKDTTNDVPGYPQSQTVQGNADQEVTFTVDTILGTGYKPEPGQEYKLKIKADGTAQKTIYFIVDTTQKIYSYTVKYLIKGLNTPVPGKPEVTGMAYIKEKITIDLTPVHGYKPSSGNDLEVMITHNNQVIDIYYEVNQNDKDFRGIIYYKVRGTEDPVPGVTPNPLKVTGYVGQIINIPTPLGTGYKVESGQDLTLEILYNNSASKTVYYAVDQDQLIYEYSVFYYIKDTILPVPGKNNIIKNKAYINQEIEVDLTLGTGYKVVDGTTDKYVIDKNNKIIKIYYEVDQNQTQFTGKVNYYIINTKKQVPGLPQNQTFNGYVGQKITITPPTTDKGYKLDPATVLPIELVIKVDNSAEIDVYYVVDQTQKVYKYNVYYYLGQTGEVVVPGKPHILNQDAYIGEPILVDKANVKGYKPIDGQIDTFNVDNNPTNVIIRYEINKLDKSFTGEVYYKIKGTNENVPGLVDTDNNPVTLTGYLGEEVDITYYLSNEGYKVDENQPHKLTLNYDNTAKETVYYVVDKEQKIYNYSIYYYIKDTETLVPGKTHKLNQKAYIDEPVTIDLTNGTGYKALSNNPPIVTIDVNNKVIKIYYEINTADNNFIGTIKYRLLNGDDVPGIVPSTRTVTGHIDEVKELTHPIASGYKVRDGEPTSIKIKGDNSAEITVIYIVDENQKVRNYRIDYFIDGTTKPVPGKDPVIGTGYIGQVIPIIKDKVHGYEVKPGQVNNITLDVDQNIIIYYIVDKTQLVNTYNIYYKIKGTNDPVPGKTTVTGQAYIGQKITVIVTPTTTGYKVVEGTITEYNINDNPTNIDIFYEIDKSQNQFTGKIYYYIDGTTKPVEGIDPNPKVVKGYHKEKITITYPTVTSGYKVKANQPAEIVISYDNSSEKIVYYEVDVTQKVYKYNIYYRMDGTDDPVPGKADILNKPAYIGEEINIDFSPSIGYKARAGQEPKLVVNNPTTSVTIYYIIDTDQTPFNYTIAYRIEGTDDPVPGKVDITGKAYINQEIPLIKTNGIGYKAKSTTPETIRITGDNFRFVIYYEVDHDQNQFIGTIKYYIKGSTIEVPGIEETPGMVGKSTKTVKGYVGQTFTIPHPVISTGYKVMAKQPTEIKIKYDNTATEIVYYEVDESQLIWKYSILYRVHPSNEPIPYRNDIVDEMAYIGKKVHVDISPIAGYKLYGSPSDELVVDTDGKSVTIYYEIDTNQKFNYQVDYVNSETNQIIKESLIAQAPVGKLMLTHPVISGYQIIPGQNDYIIVNNTGTAKLVVKYSANIDTKYVVHYYHEKLEGGYKLEATFDKKGKTDTVVNAEILNNWPGFTHDATNPANFLSGKVKGDGTLLLKVYYNRNRYNVTFDTKGGNTILPKEYKYDQEVGVLETPVKLGYNFVNWKYKSNNLVVNPTDKVKGELNLYAEYKLQDIVVNITGYTGPTTYDGNPIHLTAEVTHPLSNTATYRWTKDGVQVGTNKELDINGVKESGKYKVEVTIDGVTVVKEIDITINKASYDLSGLKFETQTFEYDGNLHKIEVTGLPAGVTVKKYTNNQATNAGVYNAVVEFEYDKDNYEPVPNLNAILTITKANLIVTADNLNKVFNTADPLEFTYVATGFKGSDNVTLLTGKLVRQTGEDVGTYDILIGTLKANDNYNIQYNKGTFTINPAQIEGINLGSSFVKFNNQPHPVEVTGLLPGDVVEYTYNGHTQNTPFEFTNADTYEVQVRVKRPNHSDFVGQVILTINKFEIQLSINNVSSNRLQPQTNLTYTVVEPSDHVYPQGILIEDIFNLYVENFNPNVAGTYQILVNEKMANNFEITYTPGQYTVNRLQHFVKFIVEGEEYLVAKVLEGDNIPYPTANPTKTGYIFEKWTPSDVIMPQNDITFTAVFKVDTSLSYNGTIYYKFRHNGLLVPNDKLGSQNPLIVTGHADQEIQMPRNEVLGYVYENGQALNIKIKTDGTAEYTLYLVKDPTKWIEVNFVSGPNATLSGQQTFEMLKDIPLNDSRQYYQITAPSIMPNPGYFENSVKWSPELNLAETLTTNKTYIARVGKKYNVNVYDKQLVDYNAKQVIESDVRAYVLSHDGTLYLAVSAVSDPYLGVQPGTVGIVNPSNYENKIIRSIHGTNGVLIIITEDNFIYGYKKPNVCGEFGQGDQDVSLGFVKVDPSTYENKAIKSFYTSLSRSYIITTDGDLYGTGSIIGNGQNILYTKFTKIDRNQFFGGRNIIKIVDDMNNTVFLTDDNKAYMTGNNTFGQFGDTNPQVRLAPQLISNPNLTNIVDVIGRNSSYVWLNDRNELYVTGQNIGGIIYPDPSKVDQSISEFTKFDFMNNIDGRITNMAISADGLLISTDQNKVYYSGYRRFDFLGLPNQKLLPPTLVNLKELTGKTIQMIQDMIFGFVIKADGKLYYAGLYGTHGNYMVDESPETSIIKYFKEYKYLPTPYRTYEVISGETINITDLPYTKPGYHDVTVSDLYINQEKTIPFVNNSVVMGEQDYNIFIEFRKDATKWIKLRFESGPNAYFNSGNEIFEVDVLKGKALNAQGQPNSIIPQLRAKKGYFINQIKWDTPITLDSVFNVDTTIRARVNKKYNVNVYTSLPAEYNVKKAIVEDGYSVGMILTYENELYMTIGSKQDFGLVAGSVYKVPLSHFENKQVKDIFGNGEVLFVQTVDNNLYVYKNKNENFARLFLGLGDVNVTNDFVKINPTTYDNKPIKDIQVSWGATIILTTDGSVYAAGYKSIIGLNSYGEARFFEKVPQSYFNNANVVKVISQQSFTMYLTEENKLYFAGVNNQGQFGLGDGTENTYYTTPTLTTNPNLNQVIDIAAHSRAVAILNSNNEVYVAGSNMDYNIGPVGVNQINTFTRLDLTGVDGLVSQVKLNQTDLLLLTNTNKLYFRGKYYIDHFNFGAEPGTILPLTLVNSNLYFNETISNILTTGTGYIVKTTTGKVLYSGYGQNLKNYRGLGLFKYTPSPYKTYQVVAGDNIEINDLPYVIPGYHNVTKLYKDTGYLNEYVNNSQVMPENEYNLYAKLEKDNSQWTTITFVPNEYSTLFGTTKFDVIKGIPINDQRQPIIVNPPTIHPNSGCKVDPNSSWDGGFQFDMVVDGPRVFTARVLKEFKVKVYEELDPKEVYLNRFQDETGYSIPEPSLEFTVLLTKEGKLYVKGNLADVPFFDKTGYTEEYILVDPNLYDNNQIDMIRFDESVNYRENSKPSGFIITKSGHVYTFGTVTTSIGFTANKGKGFHRISEAEFGNAKVVNGFVGQGTFTFITNKNKMYMFGNNINGLIPYMSGNDVRLPSEYEPESYLPFHIKDIVYTEYATFIVLRNGDVYISKPSISRFKKLNFNNNMLVEKIIYSPTANFGGSVGFHQLLFLSKDNKIYFGSGDSRYISISSYKEFLIPYMQDQDVFTPKLLDVRLPNTAIIIDIRFVKYVVTGNLDLADENIMFAPLYILTQDNKIYVRQYSNDRVLTPAKQVDAIFMDNIRYTDGSFENKNDFYGLHKEYGVYNTEVIRIDLPYKKVGYWDVTKLYKEKTYQTQFRNNTEIMQKQDLNLYFKRAYDTVPSYSYKIKYINVETGANAYAEFTGSKKVSWFQIGDIPNNDPKYEVYRYEKSMFVDGSNNSESIVMYVPKYRKYLENHYYQMIDSSYKKETHVKFGVVGNNVTITEFNLVGYVPANSPDDVLSGVVKDTPILELTKYYNLKRYTVDFNIEDLSSAQMIPQTILHGGKVQPPQGSEPSVPEVRYWSKIRGQTNLNNVYDFETPVTSSFTLYPVLVSGLGNPALSFPSTKVTNVSLKQTLNAYSPAVETRQVRNSNGVYHTERIETVVHQGIVYEKYNNEFYQYRNLQIFENPYLNTGIRYKATANIIDYVYFDNTNNNYSTSYIKDYIEKIVLYKLGRTDFMLVNIDLANRFSPFTPGPTDYALARKQHNYPGAVATTDDGFFTTSKADLVNDTNTIASKKINPYQSINTNRMVKFGIVLVQKSSLNNLYPQRKITSPDVISALNRMDPEIVTRTFNVPNDRNGAFPVQNATWRLLHYGPYYIEKLGNNYYIFEPIAWVNRNGYRHTEKIIDAIPFHREVDAAVPYDNSYIKKYIDNVIMFKTRINQANLLTNQQMTTNPFPATSDPSDLRKSTYTDYALEKVENPTIVQYNFELRVSTNTEFRPSYWLQDDHRNVGRWYRKAVINNGSIYFNYRNVILGVRLQQSI